MINHRINIFYHCPAFLRERGLNDTIAREYIRRVVLPSPQKILSKRKKKKDKRSDQVGLQRFHTGQKKNRHRSSDRLPAPRRTDDGQLQPGSQPHTVTISPFRPGLTVPYCILHHSYSLFPSAIRQTHRQSTPPPSDPTRVSLSLSLFLFFLPEYIRRRRRSMKPF